MGKIKEQLKKILPAPARTFNGRMDILENQLTALQNELNTLHKLEQNRREQAALREQTDAITGMLSEKTISLAAEIGNLKNETNSLNNLVMLKERAKRSGINKEKADYFLQTLCERGVSDIQRNPRLIVSLTSFPDRMYDIKYTLCSLLKQTMKPDMIILWLAVEQFPNREKEIGSQILALEEFGITIRWTNDIGPYKKLIPALQEYSEDIIVTADDDIFYPKDWLEKLYQTYLRYPKCVCVHRCHRIKIDEGGKILPYDEWERCVNDTTPSYWLLATGAGGCLYPPHVLSSMVTDRETFMQLAPWADDMWVWAMAVLNQTKIAHVKDGQSELQFINPDREFRISGEMTLSQMNVIQQGNDRYLNNIVEWSNGKLIDQLFAEKAEAFCTGVGSAKYWEQRYRQGGNSGAGSYNHLAAFKARILNQFVSDNHIDSIIEWGCGDGNQLRAMQYPSYVGVDVSDTAITLCKDIFRDDKTKTFYNLDTYTSSMMDKRYELALSLDVIFHLVEDSVFEAYMTRLFSSAERFVIIYSSNTNEYMSSKAVHVRHRKFSDFIDTRISGGWMLSAHIPNAYPFDPEDEAGTSFSDFWIYQRNT